MNVINELENNAVDCLAVDADDGLILIDEIDERAYYQERLDDCLSIWHKSEIDRIIELGLIDSKDAANFNPINDDFWQIKQTVERARKGAAIVRRQANKPEVDKVNATAHELENALFRLFRAYQTHGESDLTQDLESDALTVYKRLAGDKRDAYDDAVFLDVVCQSFTDLQLNRRVEIARANATTAFEEIIRCLSYHNKQNNPVDEIFCFN